MFGLTKVALDAMKAREMAKTLGVIPHPGSAWKYALRQLRDGHGNPLEGKALGEAKAGLGKLPNNMKQKMTSVAHRVGGDKEISAVLYRDDTGIPALSRRNENLTRNFRMDRAHLGNYDEQLRDQLPLKEKYPPFGPYRIGNKDNVILDMAIYPTAPYVDRTVHTHTLNPTLARAEVSRLKQDAESWLAENNGNGGFLQNR